MTTLQIIFLLFLLNCSCSELISDGKDSVETPKETNRSAPISSSNNSQVASSNPTFVPFPKAPIVNVTKASCSRLKDSKYADGKLEVNLNEMIFSSSSFLSEANKASEFCLVTGTVLIPTNHIFNIELQDTFQQVTADLIQGDLASLSVELNYDFKGVDFGNKYSADIFDLTQGTRDLNFKKIGHDAVDAEAFKPMTCSDIRKTDTTLKFEIHYSSYISLARSNSSGSRNVSVEFLKQPRFSLNLQKCL